MTRVSVVFFYKNPSLIFFFFEGVKVREHWLV